MTVGIWAAPGRINLIGEHTDYNDGYVLPLALRQRTTVRAAVTDATTVRATTQLTTREVSFNLSTRPGEVRGWAAYIAGVAWALRAAGHQVPGMQLHIESTVPIGAGLSSSAALECAVAVALDELGALGIPRTELALLARRAENDYVGVPCGVMDQMAAMHGQAGHVVFLDCRSLIVEHVPFDPAVADLALVVIDTRAQHRLVDSDYSTRQRTCEQAAAVLGVQALRDLSVDGLDTALAALPDETTCRRVRHVVTENARVLDTVALLRKSELRDIGPLLTASHTSMRDDYEITVPEVDVAVETALAAGALGARMTGGGFGGCVVALADSDAVDAIIGCVRSAFAGHGFAEPLAFVAEAADGARRVG